MYEKNYIDYTYTHIFEKFPDKNAKKSANSDISFYLHQAKFLFLLSDTHNRTAYD